MDYYTNLSLENITEIVDGILFTEEWKDIKGYEGLYKISSFGRIKTLMRKESLLNKIGLPMVRVRKEAIKKQKVYPRGYLGIDLIKDKIKETVYVHRLVAEQFIPNPENKRTVNHKKAVKSDNRFHQLEWATYAEQFKHSRALGIHDDYGSKSKMSKLNESQVIDIRQRAKSGKCSSSELAKEYSVSTGNINCIVRRQTWKHVS